MVATALGFIFFGGVQTGFLNLTGIAMNTAGALLPLLPFLRLFKHENSWPGASAVAVLVELTGCVNLDFQVVEMCHTRQYLDGHGASRLLAGAVWYSVVKYQQRQAQAIKDGDAQ